MLRDAPAGQSWRATLRYAILAVLRYATLRYATLRYATLRYATRRYATLRDATLCLRRNLGELARQFDRVPCVLSVGNQQRRLEQVGVLLRALHERFARDGEGAQARLLKQRVQDGARTCTEGCGNVRL